MFCVMCVLSSFKKYGKEAKIREFAKTATNHFGFRLKSIVATTKSNRRQQLQSVFAAYVCVDHKWNAMWQILNECFVANVRNNENCMKWRRHTAKTWNCIWNFLCDFCFLMLVSLPLQNANGLATFNLIGLSLIWQSKSLRKQTNVCGCHVYKHEQRNKSKSQCRLGMK